MKTYICTLCCQPLQGHDDGYRHWLRFHSANATPPKGRKER